MGEREHKHTWREKQIMPVSRSKKRTAILNIDWIIQKDVQS
jgi:hypothetical protein